MSTRQYTNSVNKHLSHSTQIDLSTVRDRLADTIEEAYQGRDNVLIESLPITGKSYSTFEQAKKTDTDILYLTSLNELKNDAINKCNKFGLSHYKLPTPHDECPSFDANEDGIKEKYNRGMGGAQLHEEVDLSCSGSCPYMESLNQDLSGYDVLIGNPTHAYNSDYLENRVVVKDEFSEDEYETEYHNPRELVNRFIWSVETFPFNSFGEILNDRHLDSRVKKATEWFEKHDVYRDAPTALELQDDENYHVHAPLLTYALLQGREVNDGWEKTETQFSDIFGVDTKIGDNAQVVFDSERESMYLLNPPDFSHAEGFIGLDGTPIPEMWNAATGLELDHIQVLSEDEKKEYITDVLNLEIKQVSEYPRYYQSSFAHSNNVAVNQDTSLAYTISEKEDENPGLITSKKAHNVYDEEIYDYVEVRTDNQGRILNFGSVLSRNEFEDKHLGFVTGMRNYGDEYVFKWGCYLDKSVSVDRSGEETEYQFGDESFNVFPLYRNLTLQDVFRFGRDDEPTTVYVNTSGLPEWVPVDKEELQTSIGSERKILNFLSECGGLGANTEEIERNTDMSKRNVQRRVDKLEKKGKVDKHTFDSSPIYTLNN